MKKIIVYVALMVSSLVFSQNAFDKLEDKDGVESIVVSKKMFDLMSKVKVDAKDKEMQQYMNLLKKLDNLSVRKKLIGGFSAILLITLAISILSYQALNNLLRIESPVDC